MSGEESSKNETANMGCRSCVYKGRMGLGLRKASSEIIMAKRYEERYQDILFELGQASASNNRIVSVVDRDEGNRYSGT